MSDSKGVEVVVGCVLMLLGGVSLFLLAAFSNSVALMCLWSWYVVPLGVKSIGIIHALGLGLLVSLAKGTKMTPQKEREYNWSVSITMVFMVPAFALFFGWIVHFFM